MKHSVYCVQFLNISTDGYLYITYEDDPIQFVLRCDKANWLDNLWCNNCSYIKKKKKTPQ